MTSAGSAGYFDSMDVIETLSAALGLAALAGINLYLTVFVTGLAVHFGWVALPSNLQDLSALGSPWVIAIAGALYFLEFFADKTPWIDSMNDVVHTMIRPLGASLLAVLALGESDPAVKVVAALLAGGVALSAHLAKAGTRLMANASPEPFSNIGLSVGEDVLVLGGLGLLAWNPLVASVVALLALGIVWALLPGLLRSMRATAWLAWRKLNSAPSDRTSSNVKLPRYRLEELRRAYGADGPIDFAARCLSGGGPGVPKNRFGALVRFESGRLVFTGLRRSSLVVEIPSEGTTATRESRFLCEQLVLRTPEGEKFVFVFDRSSLALVDSLAGDFEESENADVSMAGEVPAR